MAPRSAALQPSRHRILSRKDTVHNTVRPVDDMSTANRRRVRHEENLLPPCSAQADVDAQPQTRGYSQRIWPSQRSTKSMLIISSSLAHHRSLSVQSRAWACLLYWHWDSIDGDACTVSGVEKEVTVLGSHA